MRVAGLLFPLERCSGDLVGVGDQHAAQGVLANDLGVAARVGRAGHALRERVEVRQIDALACLAEALELEVDGHHVGRLVRGDQRTDHRVDRPVFEAVEVRLDQQIADAVPGPVVEQQAAKHRLLGFGAVGWHAQASDFVVAGVVVERHAGTSSRVSVAASARCACAPAVVSWNWSPLSHQSFSQLPRTALRKTARQSR
jgi:hypothetical protein